jgi:predicted amidophosphoribosyltransferase
MVSYENLPEVFYLGIYQPLTGECEDFDFTWYSSKILDLKDCEPSVVEVFADCVSSNLANDFDCLAIVPSHYSGVHTSGIKILVQEISRGMKLVDATSCLIRHKTIEKLATGGSRSIETHLNSIKVVNKELIAGKKVLLFDDISTTNNSLKACKQLLERAVAKTVKGFVLGKTTRFGEDLEVFCRQYDVIQQRVEEEVNYLRQQLDEDTEPDYERINNYRESEMEKLWIAFYHGYLSEKEYNEQSYALDEYCSDCSREIDSKKYDCIQSIDYDAECQIEKLNNFYNFSSLDTISC